MDKYLAKKILAIRNAIVSEDYEEAFHRLYSIASPAFDKTLDEVWVELEKTAEEPMEICATCNHHTALGYTCGRDYGIPDTINICSGYVKRDRIDFNKIK